MVRVWSVLAAALAAGPLLAGCSASGPSASPASTAPTPIARLDTAAVRLARVEFCDRVADASLRRALAGKPQDEEGWGNGDPAPMDRSQGDVTHELGCAWTGAGGAAARAWVFARPVDHAFATTLVHQAGRQKGCTAEAAKVFGSPALLQTCTLPGGVQRVRRAGLFGDTWLTCEVAGAASGHVRTRTDSWCAAVVAALDTGGG